MEKLVKVEIDRVPENACLAADINSVSGDTLLTEGTTLSSDIINSLSRRGIESVVIKIWEEPKDEKKEAEFAKEKARLERLFSEYNRSPLMSDLKTVLIKYMKRKVYGKLQ